MSPRIGECVPVGIDRLLCESNLILIHLSYNLLKLSTSLSQLVLFATLIAC